MEAQVQIPILVVTNKRLCSIFQKVHHGAMNAMNSFSVIFEATGFSSGIGKLTRKDSAGKADFDSITSNIIVFFNYDVPTQ